MKCAIFGKLLKYFLLIVLTTFPPWYYIFFFIVSAAGSELTYFSSWQSRITAIVMDIKIMFLVRESMTTITKVFQDWLQRSILYFGTKKCVRWLVLLNNITSLVMGTVNSCSQKIHVRKQFLAFHGIMFHFSSKLWNLVHSQFQWF